MSKASEEALEALHNALAETLAAGVKDIKRAIGNPAAGEIKGAAALLNVARQFLKDNGVESLPNPGSPTKSLLDEMPFEVHEESPGTHPKH